MIARCSIWRRASTSSCGSRRMPRPIPASAATPCLVPLSAIRTALAEANATQLLDESRQRLTRRWPSASADLDLGRIARLLFVGVVAAIVGLAVLAPLLLQLVLLPLVGVVLMVPALFRLLAALSRPDVERPPAPPLTAAELPIYSVLVPLCDEAQMVPLLRRALSALDYPPEKLELMFVVERAASRPSRRCANCSATRASSCWRCRRRRPSPSRKPLIMPCPSCAASMWWSTTPRTSPTPTSCGWPPPPSPPSRASTACRPSSWWIIVGKMCSPGFLPANMPASSG